MGIEENKSFVKEIWATILGGDVERALASFTEDATWFLTGAFRGVSGLKQGKEEIRAFLAGVTQAFPDGMKSEIRKIYGEGDTVVLECVNRGTSATGKSYENDYCFVWELEAGRIRAVREYVDLEKVRIALS